MRMYLYSLKCNLYLWLKRNSYHKIAFFCSLRYPMVCWAKALTRYQPRRVSSPTSQSSPGSESSETVRTTYWCTVPGAMYMFAVSQRRTTKPVSQRTCIPSESSARTLSVSVVIRAVSQKVHATSKGDCVILGANLEGQ